MALLGVRFIRRTSPATTPETTALEAADSSLHSANAVPLGTGYGTALVLRGNAAYFRPFEIRASDAPALSCVRVTLPLDCWHNGLDNEGLIPSPLASPLDNSQAGPS